MTLLAGFGIGATGALVVFGALTGRLAAMIAAIVKPSDLASSGSYVNGTPDFGLNAANGPDASANLLTQLVARVNKYGLGSSPQWKNTVEPLVIKATQTRKQSDYDAAIAAVRQLLAPYQTGQTPPPGGAPAPTTAGGTAPHGA